MNSNGYLKFILTVLTAAVIFFGYLIVSALDRVRESNYFLADRLAELKNRPVTVAGVPGSAATQVARSGRFANREFFSPEAEVGGRLIMATQADTPNLNFLISNEQMASVFTGLCSSALAERNHAHPEEFEPLMAESWTISKDHRHYRIKLRPHIRWQSYIDPDTQQEVAPREVTAHDFKFFVDVIKNEAVNCAPLRTYYAELAEVRIINDLEFEVTWANAYYDSLPLTLGLMPLPRHFYAPNGKFDPEKFNNDHRRNRMIVGCGPYKFAGWEKDRAIYFKRNPDYFGIAYGAAPAIEKICYEVIKHPNTRLQAFLGGKLDQLQFTPDQWIKQIPPSGAGEAVKFQHYQYLQPQFSYIGYNEKNPLFQDRRVRQALTLLVDRERILKELMFNLGKIAVGPFFPGGRYTDPNLKPWPYNPALAKQKLREAGWRDVDGDGILEKDGRKLVFTMLQIATSSFQQKLMPLLKESFATAGIDMKIQNVEWSVLIQRINARSYDACCLGWSSSFEPGLHQIWHSSQSANEGSNHISYNNPEIDRLVMEFRRTFEMSERIKIARRVEKILHEDQPYTFLFYPDTLVGIAPRYRNVKVFPGGIPSELFYVPRAEWQTANF